MAIFSVVVEVEKNIFVLKISQRWNQYKKWKLPMCMQYWTCNNHVSVAGSKVVSVLIYLFINTLWFILIFWCICRYVNWFHLIASTNTSEYRFEGW